MKSATTKPFLRWAGAKRRLVAELSASVPTDFDRYFEPFLGSATLFFHLAPSKAVLGDRIPELIATYRAVRDGPLAVKRHLDAWSVDRDTYYTVRSNAYRNRFQRAAQFIYLNKAGWNGLYRVNSAGQFNVPFGRPKSQNVASAEALRTCASALRGNVDLQVADFEDTLQDAKRTAFIYLDPPYVTGHANNGFIDYNESLFSWHDQERLARTVEQLALRGCRVLLSNADHPSIRALYDGFAIRTLARHSTLAGNAAFRRPITELLIQANLGDSGAW